MKKVQRSPTFRGSNCDNPSYITIYDDLSLWSGGILIEDRGEDDSKNLIYGHPGGEPYIMLRQ